MAAIKMEKVFWVWNVIVELFVKILLPNFQKIYSILITLNNLPWFFCSNSLKLKVTHFYEQCRLVLKSFRVGLCLQLKFLVFRLSLKQFLI